MARNWDEDRAAERIGKRIKEVDTVEVKDYVRDMSLENIPTNKAYRLNGTHLYCDIVNLVEMLGKENESDHRKALRFLNLHYRAVNRVLAAVDAIRVDFAGPRLHAVITKPYDKSDDDNDADVPEAIRTHRAIATAQLIIDVLKETGDEDESIPSADVRVGIDSGKTLVVNNGRNGNREPLFLGEPANRAAKLAAGAKTGIFLTNDARAIIGLAQVKDDKTTALTDDEIAKSKDKADLGVDKDDIVEEWRADLAARPIKSFQFYRHTPPFSTLRIKDLAPGKTVRQEAVSIYADIDGFTKYVRDRIDSSPEDVVKTLHVIRAEMDAVLHSDFCGRKVRFIGDCIHGLLVEGTAQTTDEKETVSTVTMAAGAIRSSFDLCLEKLEDEGVAVDGLGLAIGFEYGVLTVTRLGIKGDMVRCSTSKAVLAAEREQQRCSGEETSIGQGAYDVASDAVRRLFGVTRKGKNLTYDKVMAELEADGDETATKAENAARATASPSYAQVGAVALTAYALLRLLRR